MIREAIARVVEGQNLGFDEAKEVMSEIMAGECTPAQISAYITALRMKGETDEEIAGSAMVMREKAIKIEASQDAIDTCGTGGDRLHTFNISTISAFVVAGCDLPVAKHGNRSVSSKCGSADLLEGLGVRLELSREQMERCFVEIGFVFLFAPLLHPAMKHAISPRREIGIRTIFNILGPLTNPAGAKYQLLGVYDEKLCLRLANVLKMLGSVSALVVHGADGQDEASITSETIVAELYNGEIKTYTIAPEDFGLKRANLFDIKGGEQAENVRIAEEILRGEEKGAKRDAVLLNAGLALYSARRASTIKDGIEMAKSSIDSGSALDKLNRLRKLYSQIS
ncbi:anthranilate phosphoribosyltransferase [bacterium]|nr:anthranilate phosphoribosyltransferase [bacterium]